MGKLYLFILPQKPSNVYSIMDNNNPEDHTSRVSLFAFSDVIRYFAQILFLIPFAQRHDQLQWNKKHLLWQQYDDSIENAFHDLEIIKLHVLTRSTPFSEPLFFQHLLSQSLCSLLKNPTIYCCLPTVKIKIQYALLYNTHPQL